MNRLLINFNAEGANGDGMAIVSSLKSFDREQQKEYHIPIIIKDSGDPAMSGTSTLTIIIGDQNDNKMQPGSKDIFVYNYVCILPYPRMAENPRNWLITRILGQCFRAFRLRPQLARLDLFKKIFLGTIGNGNRPSIRL